jgi:hypothetical protein
MARNPRIDRNWRDPWSRSERLTDFALVLARVEWDLFCSPTFKGSVPRPSIAYGLVYRWCQDLAKHCQVPYKHLLLGIRGELGEKNGRFHLHCLVGGTNTRNYESLCHYGEWLWKRSTGGARIDVRRYDRSQAGAEYICKCLGANAYELSKYNLALDVTLSDSVIRLITGIDSSGERRGGLDT